MTGVKEAIMSLQLTTKITNKDLNVILERMEQADKDREKMHDDIKFIKENMFDPHQGLWSETKLNSQFREDSKKWRYPIGVGLISLVVKNLWDTVVK